MTPRFAQPNDAEREWLDRNLRVAESFVAAFSEPDSGEPLSLAALDRAFAAWLATGESDVEQINALINAVGIAFGSFLVRDAGFSWVVATDEHGTEMAVLALPGAGDVLVYPANFVAKRWERRESMFLEASFTETAQRTRGLSEGRRPAGKKPSFWSRLFKGD